MNDQEISRMILEGDDTLPDHVLAQMEKSPELKALYERTRAVRNLVGLKRYERPPQGFENRVRQDIMRRIRVGQETESSPLQWAWAMLTGPAAPVLRYGVAAALLAAVGVMIFMQPAALEQQATEPAPVLVEDQPPVVVPLRLAEPKPVVQPDIKVVTLPVPTNRYERESDRIQYGTMPSVPVSTRPLP